MITVYRYVNIKGWQENNPKHNDDYILGAKTKRLLKDIDQALELLEVLQEQATEEQADSMDIYLDESNKTIFLTVKLFDENEQVIKAFNVEHSIQKHEFLVLLEFLPFNLEHEINVYTFKGQVADRMNEYTDELIEIGYRKVKSIKALR